MTQRITHFTLQSVHLYSSVFFAKGLWSGLMSLISTLSMLDPRWDFSRVSVGLWHTDPTALGLKDGPLHTPQQILGEVDAGAGHLIALILSLGG